MAHLMLILSGLMILLPTFPATAPKSAPGRMTEGFTIAEILVTVMILILAAASVITSLSFAQRFAAKTRIQINARAIVQRNIEAATGVDFTGISNTPAILSTASGVNVNDDNGTRGFVENIQLLTAGSNALVKGTLTKTVSAETVYVTGSTSADANAAVKRITFQINYNYLGTEYSYAETTLRSVDTQ